MMALMQVPAKATEFFIGISANKYMFLFWVNILLLLLGTFMDLAPMLLICTPIFLPVIKQFGIDPVHFGVVMILNLGIGLLTPPVGPPWSWAARSAGSAWRRSPRSSGLLHPDVIVLLLVTYIPALTLGLPGLFR